MSDSISFLNKKINRPNSNLIDNINPNMFQYNSSAVYRDTGIYFF